LAIELALPFVAGPDARFDALLELTSTHLQLRLQEPGSPGPIYVDFVAGALAHRRKFGGGRGQPLARALGLKGGACPTVLDATAGLGRDAFVLACLGCRVALVERSPIIAALLRDGLTRAAADAELGTLIREHLDLTLTDGRAYLAALGPARRPEVVYLDPMYPHRTRTALVKKEMRILRRLVGADEDAPGLLAAALGSARNRVVVKRPAAAPPLAGPAPTMSIAGPHTRFDVYRLL
jgi:16S rRNA (guanine1516-N2)-methyltransferase